MKRMFRAAAAAPVALDEASRVISYEFSNSAVARDGNTINSSGWVLDNFKKNPVFLWAHDLTQPPIGKVETIRVSGDSLVGSVRYAEADTNPFADTVFRLVKGGFLNAVSVQWHPMEWKYSSAPGRAGGIDFLKQELWEVSQVPVPALPSALVTARKAGINTAMIAEWAEKVLRQAPDLAAMSKERLLALRSAAKPAERAETDEDRRRRAAQWRKRIDAVEERRRLAQFEDTDIIAMRAIRGVTATSPAQRREHEEIRRRGALALQRNLRAI